MYTYGYDLGSDNVAHYIHTIGKDENGNLEIQGSDVFDFNPKDYYNNWGKKY
jgi:hypothetical protein